MGLSHQHTRIIPEALLGTARRGSQLAVTPPLGRAVAAVAETGVVVVAADSRGHAHADDNRLRVEFPRLRAGVRFAE